MSGFQKVVNYQQAPAVEGDFASANPRHVMLAGEGTIVAGPVPGVAFGLAGVLVGRFAFVRTDTFVATNAHPGVTSKLGFVQRDQYALITGWLGESSLVVPTGSPLTPFDGGDFWARFVAGAAIGQKVFVNYADGSVVAGTAGSPPTGGVVTASAGFVGVGSGSGTNLTFASVSAGVIHAGASITGTGVPAGTTIVSQTSGTTGGAGVYVTSQATTASSATITGTSLIMDVTAVASGALSPGDPVSGTGVTTGSYVASQLTGGAGGVGTYNLSVAQQFAAATVTALGAVESSFYVDSTANPGELAKISTRG